MFDYHLHSSVSFDASGVPLKMAKVALQQGLKEICFTDHYDYNSDPTLEANLFTQEAYRAAYDSLSLPGLTIRRGVEFGMATWNAAELKHLTEAYPFDFVIGSVHFIDGHDPYEKVYWEGRSVHDSFQKHLEGTLECVKYHDDFDVLGHLTYVCKSVHNPSHAPVPYDDYRDLTDEIMRVLVAKGKGIEINTSGVDRAGCFLPQKEFIQRFRELGGEIVTVGSDAHDESRIGQYIPQALDMLKDIFGHVCTFAGRKPTFHKL